MAIFNKKKIEDLENELKITESDGFYNSQERTDESIDQEENVNMDFLKRIQQDAKKKLEEKENQPKEKEKRFIWI